MFTRYLLIRLLTAVVVVLGVAVIVFVLIHLVPGDPVDVMLGESAHATDKEALRQALGLDQPIYWQLLNYFEGLFQLDFGHSIYSKRPILDIVLERLPATIELGSAALGVAVLMAFPLGVLAALYRNTLVDFGAMGFALLGSFHSQFLDGTNIDHGGRLMVGLVSGQWPRRMALSGPSGDDVGNRHGSYFITHDPKHLVGSH